MLLLIKIMVGQILGESAADLSTTKLYFDSWGEHNPIDKWNGIAMKSIFKWLRNVYNFMVNCLSMLIISARPHGWEVDSMNGRVGRCNLLLSNVFFIVI